MFGSGEADVQSRFLPTLERVGKALRDEPGAVIVAGHSDNVPIRTVRFPSNFHLSLARAEAVRDVIATQMANPGRLTAEGRAVNESSEERSVGKECVRTCRSGVSAELEKKKIIKLDTQ